MSKQKNRRRVRHNISEARQNGAYEEPNQNGQIDPMRGGPATATAGAAGAMAARGGGRRR